MKYLIYWCLAYCIFACQPQKEATNVESDYMKKEAYWNGGVTYEVFVQSFYDSNGDGVGDINGLTSQLDYIAELGVEAIWLMPIHPSPTYHKYDVVDYYGIHSDYGTLKDFKQFVNEAHKRHIKIILDLVLNHTSSEHIWFKESQKSKQNPFRNFYIWANLDTAKQLGETKEATGDSDNLHLWNEAEGNKERYFGFFWHTMPDLNFDEPQVRQELFKIGKYWLKDIGVDGFRLDAARHIYPENRVDDAVAWWQEFREEMEKIKPDVFLLGEVWGEAKEVAPFLKGLHSIFNFDQCFALQNMLKEENTKSFLPTLLNTYAYYQKSTDTFYDGIFTTNHDQNRILSELDGNLDKGKLAASILLTLPGSPFIYYGEELGMLCKKPDEQIREPFLWGNKDTGQTTWQKPVFNTEDKVTSLHNQRKYQNSIFHHYKNLILLRKNNEVLRTGNIKAIDTDNNELLAYKRIKEEKSIVVLHNVGKNTVKYQLKDKTRTVFCSQNGLVFSGEIPPYQTFILELLL